eukprot:855221_1
MELIQLIERTMFNVNGASTFKEFHIHFVENVCSEIGTKTSDSISIGFSKMLLCLHQNSSHRCYVVVSWAQVLTVITFIFSIIGLIGLWKGKRRHLTATFWVLCVNTMILLIYYVWRLFYQPSTEADEYIKMTMIVKSLLFLDLMVRLWMVVSIAKVIKIMELVKTSLVV